MLNGMEWNGIVVPLANYFFHHILSDCVNAIQSKTKEKKMKISPMGYNYNPSKNHHSSSVLENKNQQPKRSEVAFGDSSRAFFMNSLLRLGVVKKLAIGIATAVGVSVSVPFAHKAYKAVSSSSEVVTNAANSTGQKILEKNPPSLTFLDCLFSDLSDREIAQVNQSRRLPDNCVFSMTHPAVSPSMNSSGNADDLYKINPSLGGWNEGTTKLPQGFEVRKGFWGFARVVPEDTTGIFIK